MRICASACLRSPATRAYARRSTAVAGQVGADVSRSLAPAGVMIVYGALSTHRQTDADQFAIPLDARSMIYGTKIVRGFWLYRWFSTTPQDQIAAAMAQTFKLVVDETIRIPEGQPVRLRQFADAVRLAEAPGHGGKPLLVLEEARRYREIRPPSPPRSATSSQALG